MKKNYILFSLLTITIYFTHSVCSAQNVNEWKLPVVIEPVFKKDTFNIVKYGAVNDGIALNTTSIANAINDCSAKGGGVVLIPNGLWMTGPLELKSNVNLHLQKNAMLIFTSDKNQYSLVEGNWEGSPAVRNQSPIAGINLENIAITGKGIIDGNGDAWRAVKKGKLTGAQWKKLLASGGVVAEDGKTWFPSEQFNKAAALDKPWVLTDGKKVDDYAEHKDFFRPNLVVLTKCKKILLEGVTFQNSAAWGLHPLMCENLTVRDVYVKNSWYAQNGDGIDVESCSNVLIENSTFDVGDDGICIKSGRDEEGRKRGMPTQNIIVRNCVVYHAHGGFVIGSEMSGGAKNLFIENCTFIGTDIGLRFKTTRGRGGIVEDVFIRNIVMKDIVEEAILFDMYYMGKEPIVSSGEAGDTSPVISFPVTEATPNFRNIYIDKVVCDGAEKAIFIRGLPEMNINGIHFKNMVIRAQKGIDITEGKDISFKDVTILAVETNPVVKINNSGKIVIEELSYGSHAELLIDASGGKCTDIKITNTDASNSKSKIKFTGGAKVKSVEFK